MTDHITLQICGEPEAVLRFVAELKQREPSGESETPWFERHGKLTPEEAADLEASTYGKPKSPEQRLFLKLEARIAEYEKAIEEQFKPALKAAIVSALSETIYEIHDGYTVVIHPVEQVA